MRLPSVEGGLVSVFFSLLDHTLNQIRGGARNIFYLVSGLIDQEFIVPRGPSLLFLPATLEAHHSAPVYPIAAARSECVDEHPLSLTGASWQPGFWLVVFVLAFPFLLIVEADESAV